MDESRETPGPGGTFSPSRRSVVAMGALGLGALAAPALLPGTAWADAAAAGAGASGGSGSAEPTDPGAYVRFQPVPGGFPLAVGGSPVPLWVDGSADHPGVVRAAGDLRDDLKRVTGTAPRSAPPPGPRPRPAPPC
nr:hypothetical protein [Phaeacidiphilus oryzae]